MTNRVILTDQREKMLEEGTEQGDTADKMRMYRLKNSSTTALKELIQIAQSPHVDQTEIFDPETVNRLLIALLSPSLDHYTTGTIPTIETDEKITDEFQNYRNSLYVEIDQFLKFRHSYADE